MLTPTTGRKRIEPTKETVIPIITQNASRTSRNSDRIPSTIATAISAFSPTSFSRRRNSSALLLSTRHFTPGGSWDSNSAITSSTAAATSIGDCEPTR